MATPLLTGTTLREIKDHAPSGQVATTQLDDKVDKLDDKQGPVVELA